MFTLRGCAVTETNASFAEFRASLEATRTRARELRAAGAAIRQRLSATRQSHQAALDRARVIQAEARERCASLRKDTARQAASKPVNAVLQALAILGRDESDLEEMADDLIAAHQAAIAVGDEDTQQLLAGALMQIGRHLATQVSPKAAGVIMN
jgi:hypothetical protein